MKKKKNVTIPAIIISWVIIITVAVIGFSLYKSAISKTAMAAKNAYSISQKAAHDEVYESFRETGKKIGDEKNHVSNRVTITIGDLKKTADLQVLSVSDVEYNIENSKITSWAKMRGTGTFTVDLTLSEFIIDSERHYVLVRCPEPQITSIKYDDNSYKELFHKESILSSSSAKAGADLTDTHKKEIYSKIKVTLNKNESYFTQAEESATMVLTNLIKAINSDIKDLSVDVEFFK